ncbi:MAG: hypothetical protein K0U68_03585 [Gammaproteobacteria bacterium]|nr:hypothetical protein [Gammaproteobacteria bacterium]
MENKTWFLANEFYKRTPKSQEPGGQSDLLNTRLVDYLNPHLSLAFLATLN